MAMASGGLPIAAIRRAPCCQATRTDRLASRIASWLVAKQRRLCAPVPDQTRVYRTACHGRLSVQAQAMMPTSEYVCG
jgi:hypothetical protein